MQSASAPMEIRVRPDKKSLSIAFKADEIYEFSAEFLRVESPSAEVRGHGESEKRLVSGKKSVVFKSIEPVGNYALKLVFSDGHSTGIYTWDYFKEHGEQQDEIWQTYLQKLEAAGKFREE